MSSNCDLQCRWIPIIKNKATPPVVVTVAPVIPVMTNTSTTVTTKNLIKTVNYNLNTATSDVITIPINSKAFSYNITRNNKVYKSKSMITISNSNMSFNVNDDVILTYYNIINDHQVPQLLNVSFNSNIENTSSNNNTLTIQFY